jgi:hypothetical protein
LIIDCNHLTLNRTTVYTTVADYSSSVATGTTLRKALDSAFSASTKPAKVVVGRSKGSAVLNPGTPVFNVPYGFTITVSGNASLVVSAVVGSAENEEDLCNAWKASLDGDPTIAAQVISTVNGTGTAAQLIISLESAYKDFSLSSVSSLVDVTHVMTEASVDAITAITDFNSDWTYFMCTNHSSSVQLAMAVTADVIKKPYVTSSAEEEAYANWDGVSAPASYDIGAVLKYNSLVYSNVMYHQSTDNYPEAVRITEFSYRIPGESSFQDKSLSGYAIATLSDGSRNLNGTELYNLDQKNYSTIVNRGGVAALRGNRTCSGIRIEALAVTNYSAQEIKRRLDTLFLKFAKLGMNQKDMGKIANAIKSFLATITTTSNTTKALDPVRPYLLILPQEDEISFEDRADGILTFNLTLYLDPSIDSTVLNLTLTYRDPAQG